MKKLFLLLFFIPVLLFSASEYIDRFSSDIYISEDGSMTVTETMKVYAAGIDIRRGIFRDFPTVYTDRHGNKYIVDFKVLSIKRDGAEEPYHTERLSNGIRVYIGSKDVFLNHGFYTYEIQYKTSRQLGFFENHDELYWNVTGNGWMFKIKEADCTVHLPVSIEKSDFMYEAYTGAMGETGREYKVTDVTDRAVSFETTWTLQPYEGMSVVVGWPKGIVREPTQADKMKYRIADNSHTVIILIGFLTVLAYYLWAWNKVGRDPKKGTVIPLFEAPDGLSPGAVRYIMRMGYDNTVFSSLLINMAVKGYIKIEEHKKTYKIIRDNDSEKRDKLSDEEQGILDVLLEGKDELEFKQANRYQILEATSLVRNHMNSEYRKQFFFLNTEYLIPAVILNIAAVFLALISSGTLEGSMVFVYLWFTIWGLGLAAFINVALKQWAGFIKTGEAKQLFTAVILTVFALPFTAMIFAFLFIVNKEIPVLFNIIAGSMLFLHILFYQLMKAPTVRGRKIMDKIEGLKMYIDTAEKDEIYLYNAPPKNIMTFEKFLPYAVALDLENKWSAKFRTQIEEASRISDASSRGYIIGSAVSAGAFTSSLGSSLSTVISSSTASPGSSSGFSGGGGGGSGGGGGGW